MPRQHSYTISNERTLDTITATPPFRPSQLATSYLRTAHVHREHIDTTLLNLRYQHEALRIASASLDIHVLSLVDAFEGIASVGQKDLETQEVLLAGVNADLEIIKRVRIHTEFLSVGMRRAVESGDKERTLGSYVSGNKMKQVAETCARTHGDLRSRFSQVQDDVSRLNEGANDVRAVVSNTRSATSIVCQSQLFTTFVVQPFVKCGRFGTQVARNLR